MCVPALQQSTPSGASSPLSPARLTMYGMRPSTIYYWRAVATDATGTTRGAWHTRDTRALPGAIAPAAMTVTTTGAAVEVENVLFNYACDAGAPGTDYILVLDKAGYVTWYQDPRDDLDITGEHHVTALNTSRDDNRVLVTVDHEYVLEYGLDGSLYTLYCRDADPTWLGQECAEASVIPDAYLRAHPHHDVVKVGGVFYILVAEQYWGTDLLDCDDDGSTSDFYPIVGDGVVAMDEASDTELVYWELLSEYSFSYGGDTCDEGPAGADLNDCTNIYWTMPGETDPIEGCDSTHANSIWVDDLDQWTISLKSPSAVVGVDASGTAPTGDWYWDGRNRPAYSDFNTVSTPGYETRFHDQHAALWLGSATDELLLFDNHFPPADSTTPTRAIRVDWTGADPDVTAQYTMRDADGATFGAATGGSVLDISGTSSVLVFAAQVGSDPADSHPVANEFTGSDTIAWTMEVECATGIGRNRPSYRGYPFGF